MIIIIVWENILLNYKMIILIYMVVKLLYCVLEFYQDTNQTKYNTCVTYRNNVKNIDGIQEWMCTCKSGKRTVGCCSHVASVIYYLSNGRYTNKKKEKLR